MGKVAEEIKEKRRLAARLRREKIKNDPLLYQQSKEKEKERYNKRKRDKKLLPVCEMSTKIRTKTQIRNRENFRAYYKRKKERQKLANEEEVTVDTDVLDNNITDPLESLSKPRLNDSSYSLRSNESTNAVQNDSEYIKSENEDNDQDEIIQATSIKEELESFEETLNNRVTENRDTSVNTVEQESLSCTVPTSSKTVKKPIRRKMSTVLLLRRHIRKTNKEMACMKKQIEELTRAVTKLQEASVKTEL